MASAKIKIDDFRRDIPGELVPDESSWLFPLITTKMSKGRTRVWWMVVRVILDEQFLHIDESFFNSSVEVPGSGWMRIYTKQLSDAEFEAFQRGIIPMPWDDNVRWDANVPTVVLVGKNIGKKNQTNVFTQALRDALSKYNKQKKLMDETAPGEVERHRPMLVQRLSDVTIPAADWQRQWFIQRKLDGVRTVMTLDPSRDKGVLAYSRETNEYVGYLHIKDDARKLLTAIEQKVNIRSDTDQLKAYLDGEVYTHGVSLQEISGQARRELDLSETTDLKYHIYDVFFPQRIDMPYSERMAILESTFKTGFDKDTTLELVETLPITGYEDAEAKYNQFLSEGYEGAILRKGWCEYQYSKNRRHSKNLLKMKPSYDDEYKIVGYTQGEKGKAVGAIMFRVETEDGHVFDVTPAMEIPERKKLFARMEEKVNGKTYFEENYLGRMMIVTYDDLSNDGVPLRARTEVVIRDYE